MNIHLLDASHAEAYRKLRLEALEQYPEAFASSYEEESAWPIDRFHKRLSAEDKFTLGAWLDELLIGTVTLIPEQKSKLKHRANIVAMYVRPEHRGSGIGRRLLEQAIDLARELGGIEQIYLSVMAHNEPAKRLYMALGFEAYGKDWRALKIDDAYHDEELMVMFL
ncbi:GNAT family N-acetyltransferase [Paenibacillus hunanensis]|uniref:Ribosomal protein S18 acetylase RimI-like enzyme n=1 Tax=Paenibacillus hunanensis TaxID=539262 RepID=A0ABU1ITI4_9BACL|nr:GNAT family N-acetyltransferase [Paenibacillus hunanensis]MCL9659993.1 GNAT family N-acetyltransferase [Paenibacillus hunanensis]MDR6242533.1 ribosomal protein S18 acetylase RimI-like enzyme [Paenibacillus hunanensis]GGJ08506.1 N-acetyltransferase [Paenibacillus hunanensis]